MMVRIEVLDHKGALNNEAIGHCEVRIGDFIDKREAAFELFFRGKPAGQIFFGCEFILEVGAPMMQQPMMEQPMMQQPMMEQPMMQQPMMQQPMMDAPMVVDPMMGGRRGLIRAHLQRAHLVHH
jgi:hypothetical protein